MDFVQVCLLGLLAVPLGTAILVAALGSNRAGLVRQLSLAATLGTLVLAAVVIDSFLDRLRPPASATTFQPELVPGGTGWTLLQIRDTGVRFFVGLDGLNVWLVGLTALLMVPAVLVSWNSVTERVNEFFAWLLVLETGMIGVFLAFDIILFYVFFELTLIPLFFLIGIWGGPERRHAARKFFIYTLAGSLITFLGLLGIVLACWTDSRIEKLTFSIPELTDLVNRHLADLHEWYRNDAEVWAADYQRWQRIQFWVFLALIAGFAIKVPLVPLHTWLPLAHVEAPTAGSVLLAGVLLKIGTYGFLRLCVPLTPDACLSVGVPLIGWLSVVGILYGAVCALAQDDIKKLVAYSSVSHLGFCTLGMFALNLAGLTGSLLQMINHGLSTGALFLLVGMLYERYHTRLASDYGGMGAKLKLLSVLMVFTCLSSAGLPGLNGFIGEALVFMGMYDFRGTQVSGRLLAIIASVGVVLGAWYLLTMLLRVFFGPVKEPHHEGHGPVADLNGRELAALAPIVLLCVVLGVYPQPVIRAAEPDLRVVAGIADRALKRSTEVEQLRASGADGKAAVAARHGEENAR